MMRIWIQILFLKHLCRLYRLIAVHQKRSLINGKKTALILQKRLIRILVLFGTHYSKKGTSTGAFFLVFMMS